jgi:hypothetical protein
MNRNWLRVAVLAAAASLVAASVPAQANDHRRDGRHGYEQRFDHGRPHAYGRPDHRRPQWRHHKTWRQYGHRHHRPHHYQVYPAYPYTFFFRF